MAVKSQNFVIDYANRRAQIAWKHEYPYARLHGVITQNTLRTN